MEASVLIALILGLASVISSICFGLVPSVRKRKLDILEAKITKLTKDISVFYDLEQLYISKMSQLTGEKNDTIKKENRAIIESQHNYKLSNFSKPSQFKREIK